MVKWERFVKNNHFSNGNHQAYDKLRSVYLRELQNPELEQSQSAAF